MSPSRPRTLPLAAALLLLCAGAAPALARAPDNTADEAEVVFELGNAEYAKGDYTAALRSYFQSYRLVPNRNVLFNIARCYEALGRFDEAYRYYSDLSREELDPDDAREVRQSLERLGPKVALLRVDTRPQDAAVFVDRVDLGSRGRSPLALALPPGRHRVIVRKEGYKEATETVQLVRGRAVTAVLELTLVTGRVELTGSPAGAEVRESAGGPVLGKLPAALALPPGRRTLFVSAPGHATTQAVVDVTADGTARAVVDLPPQTGPTGRLVVTSNREAARVRVDGLPAGFTPTVVTVAEGKHVVEVETRDVRPVRFDVAVVRERDTPVHADLQYTPPPVRAASGALLSLDEAPASTTVLTPEELRAFGWTTLAEALAAVRGMSVSDDRQYSYVGVRGFAPPGDLNTRVLILWDGHPMNDVWAGQGYAGHDLSVDLEEVERIEVVRGPSSALYGTGAFFAVVNVVPRDSLGAERRAQVTAGVGGQGGVRGRATVAWDDGRDRSVLLSAAGLRARGAPFTALGAPLDAVVNGLDAERAAGATLRGRIGGLTLVGTVNRRSKEIPTAPYGTAPGAEGTRVEDTRAFVEARYERALSERLSAQARASFDLSDYEGRYVYAAEDGSLQPSRDAGEAEWVGGEGRLRWTLAPGHTLTVGAEVQAQLRVATRVFAAEGEGGMLPDRSRTVLGAFLQDEWRLHPRLSLSAALRVDRYSDPEATPLSPRVALLVRPYARGLTKVVAGRAFRAPTVYELFYEDAGQSQVAPASLDPETITTLELEHNHDLTRELRVTVAGYHNRISRLVTLVEAEGAPACAGGSAACLVFANADAQVKAWGAEAGLHWQPGRWVLLDASYSYVTLQDADAALQSGAPMHRAAGRLLVPLGEGGVRLATQAVYQSARGPSTGVAPAPDAGGFDGQARGEALLLGVGVSGEYGPWRYFAGVQNLLDEPYSLPVGSEFPVAAVPQYGRTFQLQLTGSF